MYRETVCKVSVFCVIAILSVSIAEGVISDEQMADEQSQLVVPGITLPYYDVALGPVPAGRIAEIKVKEGDVVKKGQVLVALDNSIQKVKTEIAQVVCEAMKASMKLEEVRMKLAQEELGRITKLVESNAASDKEKQDAAKMALVAAAKYRKAVLMYQNSSKSYELERLKLEELNVCAPFDGYVSEILKEPGESVDERESVIRMVKLNPLKVYFDCPISLAGMIKVGDEFEVRPAEKRWRPQVGKVIFVSPSADAASQTFKVKLEIANNRLQWFAGIKVYVDFSHKAIVKGAVNDNHSD